MKKFFSLITLLILLGCQDEPEQKVTADDRSETPEMTQDRNSEETDISTREPENDTSAANKEAEEEPERLASLNGRYRKIIEDAPARDCNCKCIDITFDSPTEWCIVQDKIYISARCEKTGNQSADLYFVSATRDANAEREMPWNDFDTTIPIATLAFQPDGTAELDWIGFSINGEIATDYAIYGKKTLEGTYIKE